MFSELELEQAKSYAEVVGKRATDWHQQRLANLVLMLIAEVIELRKERSIGASQCGG
jgi:hypothetical protein